MNRRSFMQSILAAGVAPYVVTTAGVLMPVRQLWAPVELGRFYGFRFIATRNAEGMLRGAYQQTGRFTLDGVPIWEQVFRLDSFDRTRAA